jgi:hypothetical protein
MSPFLLQLLILASAINLALESPRLEEDDPIMVSLSRVSGSVHYSSLLDGMKHQAAIPFVLSGLM